MRPAAERREDLIELLREMREEHECPLAATRTKLVFGAGNADAELMFVGEAPGANEDREGLPFVGRAGKLLDTLIGEIGLERGDVWVGNVLKCLRYSAQVQLGDGNWERIGRLVRSRYDGTVMSVDRGGRLVPRKVVGWHASPLAGRRVFRLRYRSAKGAGAGRVGIELTGDHPVLTERGYVRVDELRKGDRIATGQGVSSPALDVVCGTLLGDGTLNRSSSYLGFGHSIAQREYAVFKACLLREFQPRMTGLSVAAVAGGPRTYGVVQVRTLAHRALRVLRSEFYPDGRKIVPPWLEHDFNDRMLAIWFMDDGHTRLRPGRQPLAEIATVGFAPGDRHVLLRALLNLGLPAKDLRGRLHFDVAGTRALSQRIAPFVPSVMRYKLHPAVEEAVPFDSRWTAPRPPEVLFDEVEVEETTHRARHDVTFFCIDVEGTHNFVTAGGVVRNCRPPGNRDPLPAEIEICKPYLFRQVDLIEPRLICTLGNFATRCLTGRPEGITRVHGEPQLHELGGRPVRIYPLFHPAAALRTPAVLETLREDIARIPALLGEALPGPAGRAPEAAEAPPGAPVPGPAPQLDLF
ncbi:MAG TPA: uracil-DNA glycosylase family protein [Thermoleophilaceae bacterium]|nr:uracil-DNA glycosylase family protein [Thermoleophilaceae bacterium]